MTDDEIREIFLAAGFTIKPRQCDLKPYVYAAARELIRRVEARAPQTLNDKPRAGDNDEASS